MTYVKPEIAVLGSASLLIQGISGLNAEGAQKQQAAVVQSDGELDD
jgi:hypothetical protein